MLACALGCLPIIMSLMALPPLRPLSPLPRGFPAEGKVLGVQGSQVNSGPSFSRVSRGGWRSARAVTGLASTTGRELQGVQGLALESARPLPGVRTASSAKPQFPYVQSGNSPQREALCLQPAHLKAPADLWAHHQLGLRALLSQDHMSQRALGPEESGRASPRR